MKELLHNTLNNYFKTLSYTGYLKDATVFRILIIQFIQELFVNEFKYYITKEDITLMKELLYQFIGSSCEISLPSYCECTTEGQGGEDIIPDVPDQPDTTPSVAYSGWVESEEDINVSEGEIINIVNNQFNTPEGENMILWFAIPATKNIVSAIMNGAIAAEITEKLKQLDNVNIGSVAYKVFVYEYLGLPGSDTYKVTIS